MEAVKAVKATLERFKGVFKTLTEQHGEVSGLMHRVSDDPEKRAELWPVIRSELLSHERGEMSEVYPELRKHEETRAIAEQHDREAGELEQAILLVDAEDFDSDVWGDRFDRVVELVQAHVKEEEGEFFPKAQDVLGEDVAERLDRRFLMAKKAAMTEH